MNRKLSVELILWAVLALLVALTYHCKNADPDIEEYSPQPLATHLNGEHFAGSESCMECHADIYRDHSTSAHAQTSAIADSSNILGSFEAGSNQLNLEYVAFTMHRSGDSIYQHTLLKNRTEKIAPQTFDVVIGSGVRGQSYATWKGDELFQLQPSYHKASDSWVNSPGFPDYKGGDRPIRDACLKCHVTFATSRHPETTGNLFDREKMVYGIQCERCHQPALKHVAFHRKNKNHSTPRFVMKYDTLERQERLDACAQCHSGIRQNKQGRPHFSFLAGDDLNEFSKNMNDNPNNTQLDVHGNQYGLLTKSKCFEQTGTMDCTTCHNPHKNQRKDLAFFNQKCIQCHSGEAILCRADENTMNKKGNNCIACHMPTLPSEVMKVQLSKFDSLETAFQIRTHLIAIYPQDKWEAN